MTYPSTITIDVTTTDIKRGMRQSLAKCPVARAVRRHFPKRLIFVTADVIEVVVRDKFSNKPVMCYMVPSRVTAFIKRFDAKQSVKPFKARLRQEKGSVN